MPQCNDYDITMRCNNYENNNNDATMIDISCNRLLSLVCCKKFKLQTIKNPDVIEKKDLQIRNQHMQIVLEATILARK